MELLLLPKFDNSSSSVTSDKVWAIGITTTWGRVPNGTLSMMFIWCPNLMFLASPWLEIYRFQTKIWSFLLTLSNSKLIFILLTLGKSKLTLFGPFTDCGQVTVILLSSGKTCCKKQFKPPFDKNSRTTHIIRFGTSHFPWFNQQQSRTGFL